MSTFVKICGITNLEDAQAAIRLGAQALGFNFYEKSPRFIDPNLAVTITRLLAPSIWRVGVFVNHNQQEVERIARLTALDTLQFHGNETPEFCLFWKSHRVIKAIRPENESFLQEVSRYEAAADFLLFDRFDPNEFGGTGKTLEAHWMRELRGKDFLKKSFVAGGLNPGNVAQALKGFAECGSLPFGVDVASGVESSAGRKDESKMRSFIQEVQSVTDAHRVDAPKD